MKNLESEPKIIAWKKSVTDAGNRIDAIRPLHAVHRKNGELLFALIDAAVHTPEGITLPNIVFVRGDACLMVVLVRNFDVPGEERFLMVRQRRAGNGHLSLEFPAGMLDNEINNPKKVAVHELWEETGIAVSEDALFPLCNKKLYSSAGASDEAIYYFGCIKELNDAQYRSLSGQSRGNPEENEHISVCLMTREEAEKEATSLQIFLGFYLFEQFYKKSF